VLVAFYARRRRRGRKPKECGSLGANLGLSECWFSGVVIFGLRELRADESGESLRVLEPYEGFLGCFGYPCFHSALENSQRVC